MSDASPKEVQPRRQRAIRRDASVAAGIKEIARVFRLPEEAIRLVNPDGKPARSDKSINSLLRDWGW